MLNLRFYFFFNFDHFHFIYMIHRGEKVQAAVRSVWVSSLNVIGGRKKKKTAMCRRFGVSHANLHVNLAKMAEIVIQRIHEQSLFYWTGADSNRCYEKT